MQYNLIRCTGIFTKSIEFIHTVLFTDAMQCFMFPLWSQALTKEFWKSETDGWIHLLTRGGFFSEQQEETIQPYNNSWWLLSYQTRRNQNHTIAHKEPLSDQSLWWLCCLDPAPYTRPSLYSEHFCFRSLCFKPILPWPIKQSISSKEVPSCHILQHLFA